MQEDLKTLRVNVRELARKSQGFPAVYEMSRKLLSLPELVRDQELREDALACVFQNCPEEELTEVVRVFSAVRRQTGQQGV